MRESILAFLAVTAIAIAAPEVASARGIRGGGGFHGGGGFGYGGLGVGLGLGSYYAVMAMAATHTLQPASTMEAAI